MEAQKYTGGFDQSTDSANRHKYMPISVKCACGQKFAAPDKLAGKRVKCTACSKPLQVPAGRTGAEKKETGVQVHCKCGKSFSAPQKLAGKAVKCPNCQKPIRVPVDQAASAGSIKSDKIILRCECGKSFAAPSKLAGKSVRCPGCEKAVKVPAAANATSGKGASARDNSAEGSIGSLLDEVGFQRAAASNRCPECKEDLGEDAILCIHCGYSLESGKQLKTKYVGRREPKTNGTSDAASGSGDSIARLPVEIPKPIQSAVRILNIVGGLSVVGLLLVVGLFVLILTSTPDAPMGLPGIEVTQGYLIFVFVVSCGFTILYFLAASMLKKGSKAGWIMSIVIAVSLLPGFPIGTIFGALLLTKLFNVESRKHCG